MQHGRLAVAGATSWAHRGDEEPHEFLEGLTSAGGQVIIQGQLVVHDNAAATAAHLLGHASLYRLGFALSLVAVLFHLAWALLFYELFQPVSRRVPRLALSVILVGCALQAVTSLLYLAPLLVLQGGGALGGFTPEQQQALAYTFLEMNSLAFDIYLVFFGGWCILTGFLIARSRFMPRILGVLLLLDGVGWMLYLVPPLAYRLFPVIAVISGVSEIPLQLWLLIIGLNEERWREQAAASLTGRP